MGVDHEISPFFLVLAGAIATSVFNSQPAFSRGLCVERAKLVKGLSNKYQEQRTNLGITATNTGALEVYASQQGTWTIVVTTTSGQACILASGHSWHSVPPPKPPGF